MFLKPKWNNNRGHLGVSEGKIEEWEAEIWIHTVSYASHELYKSHLMIIMPLDAQVDDI